MRKLKDRLHDLDKNDIQEKLAAAWKTTVGSPPGKNSKSWYATT